MCPCPLSLFQWWHYFILFWSILNAINVLQKFLKGKKVDLNYYFWTEWFQKEEGRISLSAFGVLASSLWQSVLYIVKQYKCIVMLLYYSGHITIICNYIIKAKGVYYVCFENINESVIYKTPYHQNKIRMLIIPTYIRAWGQLT